MKKLLLLSAFVLAAVVLLFPASSSSRSAAFRHWTCRVSVNLNQPCYGNFNYWNEHNVIDIGSGDIGPAFCGSYTPNGTQQGSAYVYNDGRAKDISGWNYNRLICWNLGGNTITLDITEYG